MKKIILIAAVITALHTTAFSQGCFEYSGTVCVPSDVSITEKSYKQTHGKVYHSGNSTKSITLFGPVLNNVSIVNRKDWLFKMHFNDGDRFSQSATVSIVLKAVNKENGDISQIATLSSNSPNAPNTEYEGGSVQNMAVRIKNYTLDFNTYYYYTQITISRTTSIINATFWGYSLCEIPDNG